MKNQISFSPSIRYLIAVVSLASMLVSSSSVVLSISFPYNSILGSPQPSQRIGDWVWEDSNSNGLQDDGEQGIPNVRIVLYKNQQVFVKDAITDATGHYEFILTPPYDEVYYLWVDQNILLDRLYVITTKARNELGSEKNSDFDQVSTRTNTFSLPLSRPDFLEFDLGLVKIPECSNPKDLIMLLDGSRQITSIGQENNFGLMKNFTRAIARSYTINGQEETQVGVVQFNERGDTSISLGEYSNRSDLIRNITDLIQIAPAPYVTYTNITSRLRVANEEFGINGRRNFPDILILVSDGDHNHPSYSQNPIPMARSMRDNGVSIFSVKINLIEGDSDAPAISEGIPSIPLSFYYFHEIRKDVPIDQTDLISVLVNLLNNVCSELGYSLQRNYYTSSPFSLSWTRIEWAESYEVQIADNPRFESSRDGNNTLYEYIVPSPAQEVSLSLPDGAYFWRVRAISSNRIGEWNFIDSFIVDAVP